jgi:hypothetical protein
MSAVAERMKVLGRRLESGFKDGYGFFDEKNWRWKFAVAFLGLDSVSQ